MNITFHGAAREVTGSRHLLEVNGKKILLDCGLYQGNRQDAEDKNHNLPFEAEEVDAVVLSHAHIDHSGSIPRLVKLGFKGPIYSTSATKDLCEYMLIDSARIQERENEYRNKKRKKKGESAIEADYGEEDALQALQQFKALNYQETQEIFPGVKVTLFNSGHILGSALAYFEITDEEDGKTKTLLYTGDLGRKNLPILKDPYQIEKVDYLIIESTYGDRLHEAIVDIKDKMATIVKETVERGGNLIIPSFSLGRTQEIVYTLHELFHEGKIPETLKIVVDSPLSVNLTDVFRKHLDDFDEEAQEEFISQKDDPLGFGRLTYTKTVEESKALASNNMPMIIISSAGMCDHGRVVHHLRNNIEDPRNSILIVGFMAQHTNGRRIIEGENEILLFGHPYQLRADVHVVDAFSGHADRSDLIDYITKIDGLKKTFLVHGEEIQAETFQGYLKENDVDNVIIPHPGDTHTL
jgi:metallo-beta-lactamase family protein